MNSFLTQSTIYRFHEKRHAAMAAAAPEASSEPLQAHPHATTLQSFTTDSTIYRLHKDRHHGVIHATSPAVTTRSGSMPSWSDFMTKSTIARFHQTRHQQQQQVSA